jgi:ribose transport system substrate-binding protein
MKTPLPATPAAILLALAALLALRPARSAAEGASEKPAPARQPALTFAIVYPIVHPFFEPVTEMAIAYGRSRGVRIIARGPESTDVRQQIRIMESLIAERVDGIALCATDPDALTPLADRAIAAGIPTIAFESDMPGSRRLCFLGTDNYKAGRHLAEVLARELGGRGRALICTGLPTQMSLNQRIQGIRDTLGERYPEIRIADLRTGKGDPELTLAVIEQQVARFPDFDSFTSIDATGGPAAVAIWKAKGWKGDRHKIVTFDDMPDNLAGIRAGIVNSVISQKQWTWGPLIIDRLLDLIAGRPVPDYYDTGTVEITRSNVDSYRQP